MVDTSGSCCLWRQHPCCHTFCFRSITLEEMHQFHSNFKDMSSIIEYRSSSKKEVIRKILTVMAPSYLDFDESVVSDQ